MKIEEVKGEKKKGITVIVEDQTGKTMQFLLKNTTTMQKLLEKYSQVAGSTAHKLRFIYKGRTVEQNDTTETLGMADGEKLEVFSSQIGG